MPPSRRAAGCRTQWSASWGGIAIACHTGKVVEVDALFAKAVERFGRVDGLVNNAATNPYFGPLIDTPDAAIDKTIEVSMP